MNRRVFTFTMLVAVLYAAVGTATLNGVAYNMPNPALIIGRYTYVPMGYVVSSLHSDCWWDPVEQKAKIFYPASTIEGV